MSALITNSFEHCLCEVKTNLRILNAYGNTLVPTLEGQTETYAQERLEHFVTKLMEEHSMTLDEIELAIQ